MVEARGRSTDAPTPRACATRAGTTRISPWRRCCCRATMRPSRRRRLRLRARRRRFRRRRGPAGGRTAPSARRLAAPVAAGRRVPTSQVRRRARASRPNAVAIFRARRRDHPFAPLPVDPSRGSVERVPPGRGRWRGMRRGPHLLDYCRRSANPVGRLVLRIAGYRDVRLDAWSDEVCTALQLTNFWQDLMPIDDRVASARRSYHGRGRSCAGARHTRWQAALAAAVAPDAGVVRRGPAGLRRGAGPAAIRASRDLARRYAHPRSCGAGAARRDRQASDAWAARCAVVRWTRLLTWSTHAMSRDTSFYYSFLVLPPRKRRAIVAVWDFCRAVDDAVDESDCAGTRGAANWRAWRDGARRRVHAGCAAARPGRERRCSRTCGEFSLPREPFEELIDGVEMDLAHARYPTFDALAEYCRRVASAVGLICIEIFGYSGPAHAIVRREPRHGAAADEHHPRRRGRLARRTHLPARRGSACASA